MWPATRTLAPLALVAIGAVAAASPDRATRGQGSAPADLLIVNGRVFTATSTPAVPEAVAVRGDRIVAVGRTADLTGLRGPKTEVVDAGGGTVMPGLIDSHVHLVIGAQSLDQVDLRGVRDGADARERIRAWRATHPGRDWIRGTGFYATLTRQDVDPATGDTPAHFLAGDAHSALLNTRALQLAGITRTTPDPPGGTIVKDPATGEPTGLLLETAQTLADAVLPPLSTAELRRLLQLATAEAHRAGVTTVVNVGGAEELAAYDAARREGDLRLRIHHALWLRAQPGGAGLPSRFDFADRDADDFDALRRRYRADTLLTVDMVKIMLDGVIESHTAAMLAPYANRADSTGTANYTQGELDRVIALMDRRGWQIMTHALGDRAVRMALDAYARAIAANPAPARGRRHKIEHIETIDPADVPRFGQIGVIASLQPSHAGGMNNPNRASRRWQNIGYTRSAWGFPWTSIKAAGGRLAFGSDWPVASLNPGRGMAVALNRLAHPPIPDQRLSMPEILDAYTRDGAYTIFEDGRLGTLEVGKLADIVVLAGDVVMTPPAASQDLAVAATVFNGRVVYRRP
jgi:predicted amidohydrolase YtcJ